MKSFISEIRRRNAFKVAAACLAARGVLIAIRYDRALTSLIIAPRESASND